ADLKEHLVSELKKSAKDTGLTWRNIQRASKRIGVKYHRASFGGGYVWRLPKTSENALRATCVPDSLTGEHGTHGTHDVSTVQDTNNITPGIPCVPCVLSGTHDGMQGDGNLSQFEDDLERLALQEEGM